MTVQDGYLQDAEKYKSQICYNTQRQNMNKAFKLLSKIKTHTEAGTILNHMYLFDELEEAIRSAE